MGERHTPQLQPQRQTPQTPPQTPHGDRDSLAVYPRLFSTTLTFRADVATIMRVMVSPIVVAVAVVLVVVCVRCGVAHPFVHSKRLRVYRHHAHMSFNICAWCRYTQKRFERTHGGVLDGLTAFFSARHTTPDIPHTYRTPNTNVTRRRTERERERRQRKRRETRRREEGGREKREKEEKKTAFSRAPEWHVHVGVALFAHFTMKH